MKRAQPYLPLYVQDVLTDPHLCACSASACGVYLYLLCILHKQEEYGEYRLWDEPSDEDIFALFAAQLSRQMPLSAEEIAPALRELVKRGVLSLQQDCLICDDMVLQHHVSVQRAAAGQKGGSKTQSKNTDKQKSFASTFALAKVQANTENEIEYESDIEDKKERIEGVQGEKGEENRFEQTWQVYPRKVEKAAARKAYDARLKDGWSPDELYAAAKCYDEQCRREKREQRFIKHAAVFFGVSTPFADYLPRGTPEEEEEDDLKDCF